MDWNCTGELMFYSLKKQTKQNPTCYKPHQTLPNRMKNAELKINTTGVLTEDLFL